MSALAEGRSALRALRIVVRALALAIVMVTIVVSGVARADTPSWDSATLPRELDALGAWLAAKKQPTCTEHCYVLSRLSLRGSIDKGLSFELEGSVLGAAPVAVPLFGPPDRVRLEAVTEDGKPADVGFEGDHYFVFTNARHFVVKGSLMLQGELALSVVGPLNVLEADLAVGRVVEGARLSGLASTTIHFDGGAAAAKEGEQPTVFQLARAIRVKREIGFEYRLAMRSGTDLGVVRLPLVYGEKVLDVAGSSGWRVEGTDLVIPTSGHTAEVTITGTLDTLSGKSFTDDARSTYEWWQFDADPEHRVTISGDGKQIDSGESPFPRAPTSRLFLVEKGKKLEASVQTLASVEALAAVVQNHTRFLVVTPQGELVTDETLSYENNGIDYLFFTPTGKPIFLATDGGAERIMRKQGQDAEVLIPLFKGTHSARMQTLSRQTLAMFGGKMTFDSPSYPLAASHESMTIGLPRNLHPIAVFGGDHVQWFVSVGDFVAIAFAFVFAWITLKSRGARLLGGVVLAGLWGISPPSYWATIVTVVIAWGSVVAYRATRGTKMTTGRWAAVGGGAFVAFLVLVSVLGRASKSVDLSETTVERDGRLGGDLPRAAATTSTIDDGKFKAKADKLESANYGGKSGEINGKDVEGQTGNFLAQTADEGILEGVKPVAIPLPAYATTVSVGRELVTRDRPLRATVVYVTDAALAPFGALWLIALVLLGYVHRMQLMAMRERVRRWLTPKPDLAPEPPAAPAE